MADIIASRQSGPHNLSLPLSIKEEMKMILIGLMFSEMMTGKLVEDQRITSTETLASLSDDKNASIYSVIKRPGALVSGRMLGRVD